MCSGIQISFSVIVSTCREGGQEDRNDAGADRKGCKLIRRKLE
jgi:hypothetical protein